MICKLCQAEGRTSRIDVRGGPTTAMTSSYFYDEEGRYHAHDPNKQTIVFACTNGHTWVDATEDKCWCQKENQ